MGQVGVSCFVQSSENESESEREDTREQKRVSVRNRDGEGERLQLKASRAGPDHVRQSLRRHHSLSSLKSSALRLRPRKRDPVRYPSISEL